MDDISEVHIAAGETPLHIKATTRIGQVMEFYQGLVNGNEPPETMLADLLADLMHWANTHNISIDAAVDKAVTDFEAETPGRPDTAESVHDRLVRMHDIDLATELAIRGMCLQAREEFGTDAKYCLLDDSDQGNHAMWDNVLDADGKPLHDPELWMDDEFNWAGNMADSARYAMQRFTDTEFDKRRPWAGVRIDIDKVLRG